MPETAQSLPMQEAIEEALKNVRKVLMVLSGKGGVGKSVVAASLALAWSLKGRRVAVLDADIHGPSIPWILGLENAYMYATMEGKLIPPEIRGVAVVSMELLLRDKKQPIIWRGPMKTRALIELIGKTEWGDRDVLVVDLPPGTGDEPLTIAQYLRSKACALLVLTPGAMVKHVVEKAKEFVKILGVKLVGAVMNMSFAICPNCGSRIDLFGSRESLEDVELLEELPLDPEFARAVESSKLVEFLEKCSDREIVGRIKRLAEIVEVKMCEQ